MSRYVLTVLLTGGLLGYGAAAQASCVYTPDEVVKQAKVPYFSKKIPGLSLCDDPGELAEAAGKRAVTHVVTEVAAVPTAVAIASATGATAGTGTAIATLSGAAATSSTLALVGTPVVSALGAVGVTVAAPAVVGGVVVGGIAFGVAAGVNYLLFGD